MPTSIPQHRNSQKRCYDDNSVYFIVTKTFQNFPYFKEPIFCESLIEDLGICKELKKFELYGFCLVYDHLNLLICPEKEFNISKVMKSLKENVSRNINYIIFGYPNEGDTTSCRLRLRESICNMRDQFLRKYGQNQTQFPKFKWQKSYRDHIIRSGKDFINHYNYTVYNFQKHKLPEDWKYASLNYNEMNDVIDL